MTSVHICIVSELEIGELEWLQERRVGSPGTTKGSPNTSLLISERLRKSRPLPVVAISHLCLPVSLLALNLSKHTSINII